MDQEKERVELVPIDPIPVPEPPEKKGYWEKVEKIYKIASRVLLIALPVFVVLFMVICGRAFTAESVSSFLKDVKSATSLVGTDYQSISYTFDEGESRVIDYRGGVAVVTTESIEVFAPDGEIMFTEEISMTSPRVVSSGKFLIVYDFGTPNFFVANAYGVVHQGTMPTEKDIALPIFGCKVSDTGSFAFVTPSVSNYSRVYLYNERYEPTLYEKDYTVSDIALSDNGDYIAMIGMASVDGAVCSRLEVYRIGDSEAAADLTFEGESPRNLEFTSDGYLAALTKDTLRVIDLEGKEKSSVAVNGEIRLFFSNEYGCVLVTETEEMGPTQHVVMLDKRGKEQAAIEVQGTISAVALDNGRAFLLCGENVLVLDAGETETRSVPCGSGANGVFAVDANRVRVTFEGEARLYTVE